MGNDYATPRVPPLCVVLVGFPLPYDVPREKRIATSSFVCVQSIVDAYSPGTDECVVYDDQVATEWASYTMIRRSNDGSVIVLRSVS